VTEAVVNLFERREMFLSLLGRESSVSLLQQAREQHTTLFLVLWLSYDVRHTLNFQGACSCSTLGLLLPTDDAPAGFIF
jgi:hypothetical protein